MSKTVAKNGVVTVAAYRGDAKTLLAFNLLSESARDKLAGFTVLITPPDQPSFYLQNDLRFETPGDHAQDPKQPAFSTINAPIHKFRWVHVPGTVYQGLEPAYGDYTYAVTPRYFDDRQAMTPLEPSLSVSVKVTVAPFKKGKVSVGFTRGFTQSQAFVRHFGRKALVRPKDAPLQFDTSAVSGINAQGKTFTYAQQYEWLGFTARQLIFALLDEVAKDAALSLDVFAYDLNEPDLIGVLLQLGAAKQARIILDNARLHHDPHKALPEDAFTELFSDQAGAERIKRGHFSRYSHDKVFVVSRDDKPIKVLTGSTNFSVTGLYVNSNHVLVYDDPDVAASYSEVFNAAWDDGVHTAAFVKSPLASKTFSFASHDVPDTSITFSPHSATVAAQVLDGIVQRVHQEGEVAGAKGSVLFAVMAIDGGGDNPVYDALKQVHASQSVFSYGISDNPGGIALYPVGATTGVLVTGKPTNTVLPPPFDQVPNIGGVSHQVHHKFVVCGFNGKDPVVYCGSSNLALKGEQVNGDNLLAIRDGDIATVFAIEALALVDHFNFLDSTANGPKGKGVAAAAPIKQQAAVTAGWFLGTDDTWAHKYFDPRDLHSRDRELFAA